MKPIRIKLMILLVVYFILQQQSKAQIILLRSVFGNGGTVLTSEMSSINSTLGQTAIGKLDGDNLTNMVGFWYLHDHFLTDVEPLFTEEPTIFSIEQNYPNPFNLKTSITFTLSKTSHVSMKLFDMLGRSVSVLVDEKRRAGVHTIIFNAQNLTSGVYIYQFQSNDFLQRKKLILMK